MSQFQSESEQQPQHEVAPGIFVLDQHQLCHMRGKYHVKYFSTILRNSEKVREKKYKEESKLSNIYYPF